MIVTTVCLAAVLLALIVLFWLFFYVISGMPYDESVLDSPKFILDELSYIGIFICIILIGVSL